METDYFTEDELDSGVATDNVVPESSDSAESTVTEQQHSPETLTLAELNTRLGKNYTSKEAALKSLKDTTSYVGAKKDKIRDEIMNDLKDKVIFKDQYETDMFYKDNPEYVGLRDVVDAFARANSTSPREVVNTETFKKLYESVSGYEKSQKAKTVLSSNPRIAASSNHLQEAQKAKESGNMSALESHVLNAVKEAYEM